MNIRLYTTTALGCAMAALATGLPSTAFAGDTYGFQLQTLTGAQCQPSNGTQWADFLINPDGLRNISLFNRYISCTGIAVETTAVNQADNDSTTPAGTFRFWLSLDYSQVPNAAISYTTNCTFFVKNLLNGTTTSEAVELTSTKQSSPVIQAFTLDLFNGFNPNNWDGYSFNCRLPPKVKFLGFIQVHNGSTGGYRYVP